MLPPISADLWVMAEQLCTVLFLLTVIAISGFLCSFIPRSIGDKAFFQTTVLDLIYADCVIHIFCLTASLRHSVIQIFCVTASLSLIFIAGLISADLTLPHLAAVVTSYVLNFFFIEQEPPR